MHFQDDEVNQSAPVEPTRNQEAQTEAEPAVPAPAAEAMPEQASPVPAPEPAAAPEAAPAVPEMSPQASVPASQPGDLNTLRQRANAKRTARREEHLQKIQEFLKTKPQIENHDVQDLLHVSQSTATNYLSELVKAGKIKRQGSGRAARYSL